MSTSQEPLLPRIAQGDGAAVEEFLERYKRLVWWLARKHAGEDPEDAVQEVLVEVWKNAGRFDPSIASETTFVGMIARRRLIDRHRRAERRLDTETLSPNDLLGGVQQAGGVEDLAEAALARRAIRQLDPREGRVLMMSVYEGFSHSEIARATDMPLGTVKTYIRRGLDRVRAKLGASGGAS